MKVLYAAYKHDPRIPDLSSGADYNFYTALRQAELNIRITLPVLGQDGVIEQFLKRFHKRFLHQRYAKFPLAKVAHASKQVNQAEKEWKPDVIFTMFPPTVANYNGKAPIVYRLDTTFWGWQREYPEFSRLALYLSIKQEKRALSNATKIITHSDWTREILIEKYGVDAQRIVVFANPARLPDDEITSWCIQNDCQRKLTLPLQLLFVGKDYKRKGLSTALEVVNELNTTGTPAQLTVCGGPVRESSLHVSYVGYFKKSVPEQLNQYLDLYRNTHLLIHPALFDPSPIVTSEAAAFRVPTITNANGGLSTSVKDGISGIVLPKHSPAEAYVKSIHSLISNPDRYYALCNSTRERYTKELNWISAGDRVAQIIKDVISKNE